MVDLIDTNGVKPTLKKGVLGYDDYNAGGDAGRLYVGTGTASIAQAKLSEVQAKANLTNPIFTNNAGIGGISALSSWGSLNVTEAPGGVFFGSNGTSALTGSNAYYNGTWNYKNNGSAGLQLVNQGSHQFRVAGAGLANGAITWTTTANIDSTGINILSGNVSVPAYGFLNDTDTGIYNPSANTLGLVTGGTERIRVESNGKINITGTGARITGDFSNATESNKTAFQTSTINSATVVGIIPNGTSTIAVNRIFNSSDANNSAIGNFRISSADVGVWSSKTGTGSYLPLCFYTSDSERMRVDTAGNVLVTSSGGGLGYGTGAGGTVAQLTSKSTAVTLNKPTGRITMHNAALAAGAIVEFIVYNSLVTANDTIVLSLAGGASSAASYRYWYGILAAGGGFVVELENRSASSLSESPVFNFTVIKGTNA